MCRERERSRDGASGQRPCLAEPAAWEDGAGVGFAFLGMDHDSIFPGRRQRRVDDGWDSRSTRPAEGDESVGRRPAMDSRFCSHARLTCARAPPASRERAGLRRDPLGGAWGSREEAVARPRSDRKEGNRERGEGKGSNAAPSARVADGRRRATGHAPGGTMTPDQDPGTSPRGRSAEDVADSWARRDVASARRRRGHRPFVPPAPVRQAPSRRGSLGVRLLLTTFGGLARLVPHTPPLHPLRTLETPPPGRTGATRSRPPRETA